MYSLYVVSPWYDSELVGIYEYLCDRIRAV